jgi:hypothetical protein
MSKRYARQLHSADDLIAAVEQYGFLPFFRNEIHGFSIEELCPPELWFADDVDGPWEWKGPAARSGKCLYGKLFNKKAGFVSREWIPDFANFRRDGYDFDARWDDGLASYKDKELYEAIAGEGRMLSKRLKEALNYRKGGNLYHAAANAELCLHCGFRLYAGQIRKTLWLGCRRVCDAGRAFRVRPYHIRLSARPAGIQRAHDAASFLHPAGCACTAAYEDIERIKHHEQETCSIFFCVRRDREGCRDAGRRCLTRKLI